MNSLYFFGRDKQFRSKLTKKTNLKPGNIVLDLCCGTGLGFPFSLEKIGKHGTLLGLDVSSKMLSKSKKKRNFQIYHP
jgi:demethylmenaquinone methyltransferase/2-methoxy-6-polyprenyl-1,4-benzoquinol methylase